MDKDLLTSLRWDIEAMKNDIENVDPDNHDEIIDKLYIWKCNLTLLIDNINDIALPAVYNSARERYETKEGENG